MRVVPDVGAALFLSLAGFCGFDVFSYLAIFIGYYIASKQDSKRRLLMKTTRYKLAYGGTASIPEHRDGTATLVFCSGFTREERTYKSKAIAKRVMSRWCDGCYREEGRA